MRYTLSKNEAKSDFCSRFCSHFLRGRFSKNGALGHMLGPTSGSLPAYVNWTLVFFVSNLNACRKIIADINFHFSKLECSIICSGHALFVWCGPSPLLLSKTILAASFLYVRVPIENFISWTFTNKHTTNNHRNTTTGVILQNHNFYQKPKNALQLK